MKILLVVWNLYPNTAATNRALATSSGLNENGAKTDILTIKPSTLKYKHLLNKYFQSDTNGLKAYFGTLYGLFLLLYSIPRYDLIYCTSSRGLILKLSYLVSKIFRKKIVHERTEHPEVGLSRKLTGKEIKDKSIEILRKYDHIFVISSSIKNYYIEKGINDSKVSIYPMIVRYDRFENLIKKELKQPYIAYCGAMVDFKDGISDLIESFGRTKYARHKYILKLIGETPTGEVKQKLDSLLSLHHLEGRVEFCGIVSTEKIPQELKNADILALCRPSSKQAQAGFPTKLGEYLATGNPVVITRTGDIDLYVKDEINGYLVSPDDTYMFAQKLDYITQNYPTSKLVGYKGRELARNDFNYKVQSQLLLYALEKI